MDRSALSGAPDLDSSKFSFLYSNRCHAELKSPSVYITCQGGPVSRSIILVSRSIILVSRSVTLVSRSITLVGRSVIIFFFSFQPARDGG